MPTAKLPKPAGCAGCSLQHQGFGFAPPDGPPMARLVFVAETLGGDEAFAGVPLVGAAGGVHTRVLTRAGVDRSQTRAMNCVSCQPPNNWLEGAPWEFAALDQCRRSYLQPALNQVPLNGVVMPLGAVAVKAILNLHGAEGIAVKNWHGTVTRDPSDRFWVVPNFHPSHLQRGAMNLLEVVTQNVIKAERIAREGFVRSACELVVDPQIEWFRQWVDRQIRIVQDDPDSAQAQLALDTEFPESIKGQDEDELSLTAKSVILRVNGANGKDLGWTVPYAGAYIDEIKRLLAGYQQHRGIVWLWNKYADWNLLRNAGHQLDQITAYDGMWAFHYLQSDLPRGLGFVAPLASDFGAWKHWAKDRALEGRYAAADGVQTWRVCVGWILPALITSHQWDVFQSDWHDRDQYVLRPSHEMGVPIDRPMLEEFHRELQAKQVTILSEISQCAVEGSFKPKLGYAKRPKGAGVCVNCGGAGTTLHVVPGDANVIAECITCLGTGELPPVAPKSILGGQKKGKRTNEAKASYIASEIKLVERTVSVELWVCGTCGAAPATATHRCKRVGKPSCQGAGDPRTQDTGHQTPPPSPLAVVGGTDHARRPRVPGDDAAREGLHRERRTVQRWFWQLPFNPNSAQQVLSYIEASGQEAPKHRKTKAPTTGAQALKDLWKKTGDQLYKLLLDHRAVTKVDSTYAVGTLDRLDGDDRVHPEYLPKPSTLRDSCVNPNLTNVVADKGDGDPASSAALASGFRKCIQARAGIPPGVSEWEVGLWARKWQIEER